MHEFTITEKLLQTALTQANLQTGERIERLQIALTPDAGYTPDAIRFYFEQLARDTPAVNAQLVFAPTNTAEPVRLTSIEIQGNEDEASPLDQEAQWIVHVAGDVQSASFACFVHLLAADLRLRCQIVTDRQAATIAVKGMSHELEHFVQHLHHDLADCVIGQIEKC